MKTADGSRYLEMIKSDRLTAGCYEDTMTNVTSRGVLSPKTTTNDAISVLDNGQLAIPIQTLNFTN